MVVVIVCSALLLAGVVANVRWGSLAIDIPGPRLTAGAAIIVVARRYFWWVAVVFYTGVATGVFVVGPAGRLAMRILAVTANATAQGRTTEAGEIVGRITVGGTIGLFIFVGVFFGLASALAYVLVRRWLPAGRAGGLLLGAFLFVTVATRLDPLRRDNADFDIVGPGWLAIAIYGAMALLQGMTIVAMASRISRVLPEPSKRPVTLLAYAPLLLTVPGVAPAMVVVAGFLVALILSRSSWILSALRSPRLMIAGRAALVVVAVASLPGTVAALVSIAGRP